MYCSDDEVILHLYYGTGISNIEKINIMETKILKFNKAPMFLIKKNGFPFKITVHVFLN